MRSSVEDKNAMFGIKLVQRATLHSIILKFKETPLKINYSTCVKMLVVV